MSAAVARSGRAGSLAPMPMKVAGIGMWDGRFELRRGEERRKDGVLIGFWWVCSEFGSRKTSSARWFAGNYMWEGVDFYLHECAISFVAALGKSAHTDLLTVGDWSRIEVPAENQEVPRAFPEFGNPTKHKPRDPGAKHPSAPAELVQLHAATRHKPLGICEY